MSQPVSCQPLAKKHWVQCQASQGGTVVENWYMVRFFSEYYGFPCQYLFTNAPYSYIHLSPTLHNHCNWIHYIKHLSLSQSTSDFIGTSAATTRQVTCHIWQGWPYKVLLRPQFRMHFRQRPCIKIKSFCLILWFLISVHPTTTD